MKSFCASALIALVAFSGCGGDDSKPAGSEPTKPTTPTVATKCPQDAPAGESFDAKTLVGLSIDDAEAEAKKYDCSVRAVEVDGEPQAATMDFREDRVNVVVDKGKVTGVQSIS